MHPIARTTSWLAAVTLVATGLVSCSQSRAENASPKSRSVTTTTSTTTTTSPTTTTSSTTTTTTTTTTAAAEPGLARGARGPEVQALEQRLATLRYDTGKVDGLYDAMTAFAVTAFQKVNGMPRTGRATDDVLRALETAEAPEPMIPAGGDTRVEIDLKRQVLFLYQGGALTKILPVSTGNGKRYCVDGDCARAVTPGGSFRVTRKIRGLRVSRLGKLYNPLYFNGGIAIHGAPSVPAHPASHGCVRIPMPVSRWFHDDVAIGTPVYVLGGARAPVPFNEQAPDEETTSTTSSTTTSTTTTTTTTTTPIDTTTTTTTAR